MMETTTRKLVEAGAEIGGARVLLSTLERQLADLGDRWVGDLEGRLPSLSPEEVEEAAIGLAGAVESLRSVAGTPQANRLLGRALSLLLELKRRSAGGRMLLRLLVGGTVAAPAEAGGKLLLVFSPTASSTKAACFRGLDKLHETELHHDPDEPDTAESRAAALLGWLQELGIDPVGLAGIGCRGGFVRSVPAGTYRVTPALERDLEQAAVLHSSNLSVAIASELRRRIAAPDGLLLTTSDPVACDELELTARMTGLAKVKREGTAAHYLNHKAVWRLLAALLGRLPSETEAITAHLSGGMSVALHRGGRVVDVLDAFSLPSTTRSGTVEMAQLLQGFARNELNIKELDAAANTRGGLISHAWTNDFRALVHFRHQGANERQRQKIDLILDFFARKTASAVLQLTADGKPLQVVAITGGLVHEQELVDRIEAGLAGRFPLVRVPGSLAHEALAAGLIRGLYEPDSLLDYERERDLLRDRRHAEDQLLDTPIFSRQVIYRREKAPIFSLDELIDATCVTVQRNFVPTIGIVGADNEEAILASKMANEEGTYRLAKFVLLGDYSAISQIAYDYDLVIDNDNYTIVDTDDPVEEATRLHAANQIHVLMKGSMKTDQILRGVFKYLKASGRIKPEELISHVVVMDIPKRKKMVMISDAAVNTYPDEEKRVKIVENALKVAANLNIKQPKVAIISAIESVNKSVESSQAAERIAARFASRTDCIVEGPLSFDVAMDAAVAHEKKYKGQIAGTADILIMPDIDAGNVAYKSLTTQSGATAGGVVIAGDMPMVLTSRGDSARSKLSSIALAASLYFHLRQGPG